MLSIKDVKIKFGLRNSSLSLRLKLRDLGVYARHSHNMQQCMSCAFFQDVITKLTGVNLLFEYFCLPEYVLHILPGCYLKTLTLYQSIAQTWIEKLQACQDGL